MDVFGKRLTIILDTLVVELVRFAERVHWEADVNGVTQTSNHLLTEVCQRSWVKVGWVIRQQRFDQFLEPQI